MKNGRYSSRFWGLRPSEGETTGAGAPQQRLDLKTTLVALRVGLRPSEVREIFRFDRVLCDVSHTQDEKTIENERTRNLTLTFIDILSCWIFAFIFLFAAMQHLLVLLTHSFINPSISFHILDRFSGNLKEVESIGIIDSQLRHSWHFARPCSGDGTLRKTPSKNPASVRLKLEKHNEKQEEDEARVWQEFLCNNNKIVVFQVLSVYIDGCNLIPELFIFYVAVIPRPDFNNFDDKLWSRSRSRIYRPVNSKVHLEVLDSKRWTLPSYQAWGQVMSSPVILTLAGESSFSCLVLRWMLSKFVKYVFHSCFCSSLRVYLTDRDMVCTTRSGDRFQPFPTYTLLTFDNLPKATHDS